MKSKIIIISVLTLVAIISIILLILNTNKPKEEGLNIVTSFYPVYIATLNITENVENVYVSNLTKDVGGCLHDYALSTSELLSLAKADALVINGANMESFIDKVISSYDNLKIIDSSKGIELIKENEHEYNSHIFVSISNYITQVRNIANALIELDEKNKDKYLANKDKYITKLEALKYKIQSEINLLKNKNIITFHDSLDYFAKEFGLNIVCLIEKEEGIEPSASEVAYIINKAKAEDVQAIFIEPDANKKLAETISNEVKIKIYELNPVTSGKTYLDSYINIMNKNLEVLKEALS